ncbi:hypothetical protein WN51_00879 [Melipona quadrifasciata]|uniref:Uncharacterized protein n=1 Tax=Melipona quadrifasciata TaxID=166423 RepID=A0A0N0BKR2_9HYME|nr:hypothetical protein WN51_00879 [Melipona quadrifasciata]
MEGQPRVSNEWRGGREEGWGYGLGTAAGQRPGKRRANTSGADSRASEPPGDLSQAAGRCISSCATRSTTRARLLSSAATVATLLRLLVVLAK